MALSVPRTRAHFSYLIAPRPGRFECEGAALLDVQGAFFFFFKAARTRRLQLVACEVKQSKCADAKLKEHR